MSADTGRRGIRFTDLQEFLTALDKDGDLARVSAPVDPAARGQRDRRPGAARAGPGAAVRAPDPGLDAAGDQRVRHRAADGPRARRRLAGRDRRADRRTAAPGTARAGIGGLRDALGKVEPAAGGPAAPGRDRARPRGDLARRRGRPDHAARREVVARRRRGVPQPRPDPHRAPRDRRPQPRPVPAAAARRADGRPALADPQGLDQRTPRSPSGAASGCRWRSRSAARRR